MKRDRKQTQSGKMFSHRDTCKTLGGEGCPALAIAAPAENRNICGLWLTGSCRCVQNLARTSRVDEHTRDTARRIFVHGSIREDSMTREPTAEEKFEAMINEATFIGA